MSLYLWIDIASISIPFLFSFHPRIRFVRVWPALWPAMVITATLFLLWDAYFAHWGVWGFNRSYLSGLFFGPLPIEEVLFFICIPYACLFTYFCIKLFLSAEYTSTKHSWARALSGGLLVLLLISGLLNLERLYTSWTSLLTAGLLLFNLVTKDTRWLVPFYLSFIVILIPFFIVNGILTGTGIENPVVWYDNNQNLGIRIGTIPVEDICYALLLLLLNTTLFEMFLRKLRN